MPNMPQSSMRPASSESEEVDPRFRAFMLDKSGKMYLMVGMGMIGGAFLAKQAISHLFVEGLTPSERRNLTGLAAASAAAWAASVFWGVDQKWLLSERLGESASDLYQKLSSSTQQR